jgi:hemerythrin
MTLLRWRDSLSLQVPAIDHDHMRLFELLNRVRFLDLAGDEPQMVGDALSELLLYTQTHFRREEKLMELGGYPGLDRHRRIHRGFTEKVAEIMASYRANPNSFRVHEFYDLLAKWLLNHVLGEDMQIKPFVAHLKEAQAA